MLILNTLYFMCQQEFCCYFYLWITFEFQEYMWYRKHTYMRLDGSSKISDRRDMVADFQSRSDIFVFLLSTRAGGLGINLTAADTVSTWFLLLHHHLCLLLHLLLLLFLIHSLPPSPDANLIRYKESSNKLNFISMEFILNFSRCRPK